MGLPLSGVQWTVASMSDITKYLSVVSVRLLRMYCHFGPLSVHALGSPQNAYRQVGHLFLTC